MRYAKFFHRPKPFRSDLTTESFRSLRSRKLADYFTEVPSSFEHSEGVTEALILDPLEVHRFESDFSSLLAHRTDLQGLSQARKFTVWWDEHKAAYLTRPVIHGYRQSGLTLGELLDDLHLHYIASQNARVDGSRAVKTVRRFANHKVVVTLAFSIGLLFSNSLGFLWSLAVLGPGVQMVNSYTQPVITPMAQTLGQQGAKDLGPAAEQIQTWLSQRGKAAETRKEIQETTRKLEQVDFSKLSPDEAKAKWAQFEKTYFNLFLNFNQTLPTHLRDGRAILKDWMVFMQLGVASGLASFDNQYWTHAQELEKVQAAIRQGGGATARQAKLAKLHKESMMAAEERIAGALAAWKLSEFMYPEYTKDPKNAHGTGQMKAIYASFSRSMRFDAYVKQFATQMQQVLAQMDADFLLQPPSSDQRA